MSRRGSRSTFKRGSDHGDRTLLFVTGMGNGTAVRDLKSSGPLIGAMTFESSINNSPRRTKILGIPLSMQTFEPRGVSIDHQQWEMGTMRPA